MVKLCPTCFAPYDDTHPCACSGHAPLREALDRKAYQMAAVAAPVPTTPSGPGLLEYLTAADLAKIAWLKSHGVLVRKIWKTRPVADR